MCGCFSHNRITHVFRIPLSGQNKSASGKPNALLCGVELAFDTGCHIVIHNVALEDAEENDWRQNREHGGA